MTKEQLQKELKEKVKEGVKPSDLKKFKRSKSLGDLPKDIPKAPPLPNLSPELTRSKSQNETFSDSRYPFTTLISQQEKIEELVKESKAKSDTIKLLRDKIEKLESSDSPPAPLLADQLKEKQKEVEELRSSLNSLSKERQELRKQLQEAISLLEKRTQELDNSLIARIESVKKFGLIYEKLKDTELQLLQEEELATEEIISQDKEISKLRNQKLQAKLKIQQLESDLDLTYRLAEMRKVPLPSNQPNYSSNLAPD